MRTGARRLARALPFVPAGVHLAVVDPGVGGARRAVALRAGDRFLVGPDNGLLLPAAERFGGVAEAYDIGATRWRLEPVSATFHGRDLFGPVAGHLAAGDPLAAAGVAIDPASLVRLPALTRARRYGVRRGGRRVREPDHRRVAAGRAAGPDRGARRRRSAGRSATFRRASW